MGAGVHLLHGMDLFPRRHGQRPSDTKDAVCMLLSCYAKPDIEYRASTPSYYVLQTKLKSVYVCPLT